MKSIKKYLVYGLPVLSLAVLLVLLHAVSPLNAGPLGILLVFALIYIFTASALYLLLEILLKIIHLLAPSKGSASNKKLYYIVSIVAFAPVFLLALHSIGQLEVRDFLLVIVLVAISSFYVMRRVH